MASRTSFTGSIKRVERSMRRPVVLIVDDEPLIRETLRLLLRDNYETVIARNGFEARSIVKTRPVDMVLMDLNLPGEDGLKILGSIKELDPEVRVVMLTATDSATKAVSALKGGAFDYITKPFEDEELLSTLARCSERIELENKVNYLKEELRERTGFSEIISNSPRMHQVFELIRKVSRSSSNVLVTGDSGTGKELVARAIHSMSSRADKPFVAVNCGAVPGDLMESELFGHEKGSFTGAHARKIGRFEYADGGTLFLDEVSTIPPGLQVKLLRVLQENAFERVGSNTTVKVDIRVIAATNIDLEEAVRAGTFREDLYYRLKVVPVHLPPLRERRDDIPLLARHFIEHHSKNCGKHVLGMTTEALNALKSYAWPGNIRELENLMERLVVLATDGTVIGYSDLPVGMFYTKTIDDGAVMGEPESLSDAVMDFERGYITGILNKTNWNRNKASREMKIHRNTLLLKMKTLGIKGP
jgi:DNA-binding NtrC family response regulator